MTQNVEQFGAILNIKYQGNDQVQRYIQDLQRAGAITEAQANLISEALGRAADGNVNYASSLGDVLAGLGLTKTAVSEITSMFRRLAASQDSPQTRKLAQDYDRLGSSLDGASIRADRLRISLGRVIAANLAINQLGAGVQGQAITAAEQRLARVQAQVSASVTAAQRPAAVPIAYSSEETRRAAISASRLLERGATPDQTEAYLKQLGLKSQEVAEVLEGVRQGLNAYRGAISQGVVTGEALDRAQFDLLRAYQNMIARLRALEGQAQPTVQATVLNAPKTPLAITAGPSGGYTPPPGAGVGFVAGPGGTTRVGGGLAVPGGAGDPVAEYAAKLKEQLAKFNQGVLSDQARINQQQFNAARGKATAGFNQKQFLSSLGAGGNGNNINFSDVLFGGGGGSAGGGPPGALGQFGYGFRGASNRSYAYQLGQTAKFTLFYGGLYGVLFKVSQAMADVQQQTIEYQNALVELDIVTGKTSADNQQLAQTLGEVAAAAGQSPAEGVTVGARAIGLYGAQSAPPQQQAAIATAAAQTSTQVAFLTGRKAQEVQLDLGAITQAFDLGYGGQVRAQDIDAYITRKFGLKPGATLQTTAEVGTLASSAGFGLEQQTAIAALLQARTGQTPAAVAGFLSQIYGKGTDTAVQGQFAKYGISQTGQTYAQQLQALANLKLSNEQINQFADAISKGRAGGAIRALLQDYIEVLKVANEAKTQSIGAGDQQFNALLATIGGQIAQLRGAAEELAKDLGESGLLDAFGALLIVTKEVFQSVDGIVKIFNELPRPIRDVALALGALYAASKLGLLAGPGTRLAQAAGYFPAANVATRAPQLLAENGAVLAEGRIATGATLARSAVAGGLGGAILGTLTNPVTLAIGGLLALGKLKQSADHLEVAMQGGAAATELLKGAITSQQYLDAAHQLRSAQNNIQAASGGVFGGFAAGGSQFGARQEITRLRGQENLAIDQAARVASEEALAASLRKITVFGDPATRTVDDINKTLGELAQNGASAAEQMKLLNAALAQVGGAPGSAQVRTGQVSGQVASNLIGYEGGVPKNLSAQIGRQALSIANPLATLFSANSKAVSDAVAAALPKTVGASGQLDNAQKQKVVQAALNVLLPQYQKSLDNLLPEAKGGAASSASVAGQIRASILKFLSGRNVATGLAPGQKLSGQDLTSLLDIQIKGYDAILQSIDPADSAQKVALLKQKLAAIQTLISQTDPTADLSGAFLIRDQVIRDVADAQIAQLENLRRHLQNRAKGPKQVKAAGEKILRQVLVIAANADDTTALVGIINQASQIEIDAVIRSIKAAQAVVAAALAASRRAAVAAHGAEAGLPGHDLSNVDSQRQSAVAAYNKQLNAINKALASGGVPNQDPNKSVYATGSDAGLAGGGAKGPTAEQIRAARNAAFAKRTGSAIAEAQAAIGTALADLHAAKRGTVEYYNALGAYFSALEQLRQAIVERDSSIRSSYAARSGGQLAQARVTLLNAAEALRATHKGTTAYYQALASYYQAQQGLQDAIVNAGKVAAQAHSDLTNPVAQAKIDLQTAIRKQNADKRAHRGPDVIAQDYVDTQNARNALEAASFQQRLSDVQTADQLGRISHQAYLKYLQHEHDRLSAIAHRTRQQQDELNQVDQLIQQANQQLQGQFNLGDIKLPTVYEVRRYIQQSASAAITAASAIGGHPGGPAGANTTIYVNGADTAFVLQVLGQYLGPATVSTRAVTTTRKGG